MENTAKRHAALEPLSREHDQSLQLCRKIREGLVNNVEPDRIRGYTDWFKQNYLEPHFEMEEKLIFPILGTNARVKRALANHRRIRRLLSCGCANVKVLNLLEEELGTYIRFEERILYKEIENVATKEQLSYIEKLHESIQSSDEEWEDKFWIG